MTGGVVGSLLHSRHTSRLRPAVTVQLYAAKSLLLGEVAAVGGSMPAALWPLPPHAFARTEFMLPDPVHPAAARIPAVRPELIAQDSGVPNRCSSEPIQPLTTEPAANSPGMGQACGSSTRSCWSTRSGPGVSIVLRLPNTSEYAGSSDVLFSSHDDVIGGRSVVRRAVIRLTARSQGQHQRSCRDPQPRGTCRVNHVAHLYSARVPRSTHPTYAPRQSTERHMAGSPQRPTPRRPG